MYNLMTEQSSAWATAISTNSFNAVIQLGITAANAAKTMLYIPQGFGANTVSLPLTAPITFPAGLSVWIEGNLTYMPVDNNAVVTFGSNDEQNYSKRIRCIVVRNTQSDWTNEGAIGIKIWHLASSEEVYLGATKHCVGVIFMAQQFGFVYNKGIHLCDFNDNMVHVIIDANQVGGVNGQNGWVNENIFHGGSFRITTDLNDGNAISNRDNKLPTGFRLKGTSDKRINSNTWIAPCFEGAVSSFLLGYRCFHIQKSTTYNHVIGGRVEIDRVNDEEQNPTTRPLIRVDIDTDLEWVANFVWDALYDIPHTALPNDCVLDRSNVLASSNIGNTVRNIYNRMGRPEIASVIGGELLVTRLTQAYVDGKMYLPGWNWYAGSGAPLTVSDTRGIFADSNNNIVIGRNGNFGIGKRVDLSNCHHITVVPDSDPIRLGRVVIRLFDENLNLITYNTESKFGQNESRMVSGNVYWSSNISAWVGSVLIDPVVVQISNTARYADIYYSGSTSDFALRTFTIYGHYGSLLEKPIPSIGVRDNTTRWAWQDPNTFQDSAIGFALTTNGVIDSIVQQYSPVYVSAPAITVGNAQVTCQLYTSGDNAGRIDPSTYNYINRGTGINNGAGVSYTAINADKTIANPGDIIHNAAYTGAVSGLGSIKGWVRKGWRDYATL